MKRIVFKRLASCLAVVCMLSVSLVYLTNILELKSSDYKYVPFLTQEENFDVLFFGNSHIKDAVFPMELWNDYGIVSYNFGGGSNRIATSYWVMKNALDYTTPKVVVIDCYGLQENYKASPNFSSVHTSFDAFPLSSTKLQGTIDLLNDNEIDKNGVPENSEERRKIGLLWNYSVYHSRWNELAREDFVAEYSKEKGADTTIAIAAPLKYDKVQKEQKSEINTISIVYLKKIIEECQSRGIEVLLTCVPFPASEEEQMDAHFVCNIANEYHVNYINFLDLDLVDYNIDCYDEASHLNPSGARKVTDYLGQYISENYDIGDQRKNSKYDSWHEDYQHYVDYKISNLQAQQMLDIYLMLLKDKNFNCILKINNKVIYESDYYLNLLSNLGVEESRISKDTDFIVIKEAGEQVDYIADSYDTEKNVNTAIGKLTLIDYITENDDNSDISIALLDKNTKDVLDIVGFSFNTKEDMQDIIVSTTSCYRE